MSNVLVRAKEVRKIYGSGGRATAALDNATFEIEAGSSVALIGPSGSGKTTLLHLIAGLDLPTSGSIEWPALGAREQLRPGKVAMAFQGNSLLPPLNVVENVALPILLAGGQESDAIRAAWAVLERMSLSSIGLKLPEELSGGQSQRVGIARAIVNRPALILADEPTGQQDHDNGNQLMSFLLSYITENGTALVVATHDMVVAGSLTTLWSMESGCLKTEGSAVCSV